MTDKSIEYQAGYERGGKDMEVAKQVVIDVLLKRIETLEQRVINRPTELYAVEDCIKGNIIFNSRGGCYRDKADAQEKIARLSKEHTDRSYRIVTYRLQ